MSVVTPASTPASIAAEPVLKPDLSGLRDRLRDGGHSGERFTLNVTGQEAADSIV